MSERGSQAVAAYWKGAPEEEKKRRIGLMCAATRRKYLLPTGTCFGSWTVKKATHKGMYLCACFCGTEREVRRTNLVSGDSLSCGCKQVEGLRARGRDKAQEACIRALLFGTKHRAVRNGRKWTLSEEEQRKLIFSPCYYCGVVGTNFQRSQRKDKLGSFYYNGLDRVDSEKGYVPGNVVACCKICNRAKSDMVLEEFLAWLEQLVLYYNDRRNQ